MHTEEHRWVSPSLGHEMTLKVYGHWGIPLLVFPCSRGRYFDYEGMGMTGAIASFIDGGRIKLYCIDSFDSQSWYDFSLSPADRNERHEAYDRLDSRDLQEICRAKAIPAWIDIWGHDVNHDWPWWYKQMNHFLGHLCR